MCVCVCLCTSVVAKEVAQWVALRDSCKKGEVSKILTIVAQSIDSSIVYRIEIYVCTVGRNERFVDQTKVFKVKLVTFTNRPFIDSTIDICIKLAYLIYRHFLI